MGLSLKNLRKPTPKKWRRLGNALATVSTGIAIPTALLGSMIVAGVILGVGALGKFIAEMTKEDDDKPSPSAQAEVNAPDENI